jgi:hypothetical protein
MIERAASELMNGVVAPAQANRAKSDGGSRLFRSSLLQGSCAILSVNYLSCEFGAGFIFYED